MVGSETLVVRIKEQSGVPLAEQRARAKGHPKRERQLARSRRKYENISVCKLRAVPVVLSIFVIIIIIMIIQITIIIMDIWPA